MYKKQRNALLVFFALSLMVGCKEGSTQSKPLTLPEGKANLSKGRQLTILIKNEQKDPSQSHGEDKNIFEEDVLTEKNPGITSTASVSKKSENIESETSNVPQQLKPGMKLSPIQEEEGSGVVTESTTLYPTHVAPSRNPSTNPSYADYNVIAQIGKLKKELRKKDMGKELRKKDMGDEEFIRTVSAAMAKDKKSRFSYGKHNPQYTLQQVVTMCEIQRAYFSKTDFADLTDVLIEKALEPLKEDKDVTLLFSFNYASTAAGIVQYLGEKFDRDQFGQRYEATVEKKVA